MKYIYEHIEVRKRLKERKVVLLCSLFSLLCMLSNAQSFTASVIGSTGASTNSSGGSMAWTIGEMMTTTYSSPDHFFTQGFHQPEVKVTLEVKNYPVESFSIYPNPVTDRLSIDFGRAEGNYAIYIYDMFGNVLKSMSLITSTQKQLNISFKEFADGIYLITILNTKENSRSSYKINKSE